MNIAPPKNSKHFIVSPKLVTNVEEKKGTVSIGPGDIITNKYTTLTNSNGNADLSVFSVNYRLTETGKENLEVKDGDCIYMVVHWSEGSDANIKVGVTINGDVGTGLIGFHTYQIPTGAVIPDGDLSIIDYIAWNPLVKEPAATPGSPGEPSDGQTGEEADHLQSFDFVTHIKLATVHIVEDRIGIEQHVDQPVTLPGVLLPREMIAPQE